MESSNLGVVTTGDVEDQRYNPKWFVDHKHILHSNQEVEANKLEYSIFKVPEYWRKPPQDFSPDGWYFGLHNRENLDCNGSEAVKLDIAVHYGLVGEKWVQFCDEIVDDPKAMLACYGLQNGVTNWIDEQIKHVLALDALFLATYIDMHFPVNTRRLWMLKALPSWSNANVVFHTQYCILIGTVHSNLRRVENQIPLVLIDKVVKYFSSFVASQTSESYEPIIDDLQYQQRSLNIGVFSILANSFMHDSDDALEIIDNQSSVFGKRTHILGAAYEFICGLEGLQIKQNINLYSRIRIPSTTKLEQAGINFVGVDGPLCKMSYEKKCLYLPKVNIFGETMPLIQNMVWYESQYIPDGCLVNEYYVLMAELIQAPEDWDLLIKYGVIYNACGREGFEMWTTSVQATQFVHCSQNHQEMRKAIMKRFKHKRYRLWSEFNIVFCSRPWLVLSTIVVVLVTMATLVQTYISVIGSNKMKPKFP